MGAAKTSVRRHLVLLGGGHSHLHILRMVAMHPMAPARITLVSPQPYVVYSGMVPGTLAGLYDLEAARIDLQALAARAGIRFLRDRALGIDASRRSVRCAEVGELRYDFLSVDVGSRPRGLPEAGGAILLPLKPIDAALQRLMEFSREAQRGLRRGRVVVVGAGAGGVEVAFACRARLRGVAAASVTVTDRAARLLPSHAEGVGLRVAKLFRRDGIEFVGGVEIGSVDASGVVSRDGRRVDAELVIWASGAEALPLFRESALPVDGRGFLLVDDSLRCVSEPRIFAAGDCATLSNHPDLAKAGVYAVRQGPILWRNLRKLLRDDGALESYRPQRDFLSLLSTGDGRAVLSYHGLVAYGRWVWRLKDWIDRRFVRSHAPPRKDQYRLGADESPADGPPRTPAAMGRAGEMSPCGGCAAKVSADILSRVLRRLDLPDDPRVVVGLDAPDDAAVFAHPARELAVCTADFFPAFLDDPYLVGSVAAVNATSDLYAMGATPRVALALVALPQVDADETEETLELLLRGAAAKLGEMGVALVGGHTIEGKELLVGFSVVGSGAPGRLLRKAGAMPGDRLILTKPLGTGVVLAATRAGAAPSDWSDAAIRSMLRSNRNAMELLHAAGVHACTDVTGFGLLGHLLELLRASHVAARLELDRIPALAGALELIGGGWHSSFHERNAVQRALLRGDGATSSGVRSELLFDPQTSGGLLAAVPAETVDELQSQLLGSGDGGYVIGTVIEGPETFVSI